MSGLLAYSGISTKVKAMQSKLITADEYASLAEYSSVNELFTYLQDHPVYSQIFSDIDNQSVHRETLEQYLVFSNFYDFNKLYRFASVSQRNFLRLYFARYEVDLIKRVLRTMDETTKVYSLTEFDNLFSRYSKINFDLLYSATSTQQVLEAVKDSIFYEPMTTVYNSMDAKIFDYEIILEMTYFSYIWKQRTKLYKKKELKVLTECIGTEIDNLNIIWIYRSKKYYNLSSSNILSFLIPIRYKLRKEQIEGMLNSSTLTDFNNILKTIPLGVKLLQCTQDTDTLEQAYDLVLTRLYDKLAARMPHSLAILNSYLYKKQQEMRKIITIAECIRYKYTPENILKQIQ